MITSVADSLEKMKFVAPAMERIGSSGIIETAVIDGDVRYVRHFERDQEMAGWLADIWARGGVTAIEEVYITSKMLAEGPKIFRPAPDQCRALEEIEPRLSVADYHQPFPTMIVELPESYRKERAVEITADWPDPDNAGVEKAIPVGVILRHEPHLPALFTSVMWSNNTAIVRVLHHYTGRSTISEILNTEDPPPPGSFKIEEQEEYITKRAITLAINAMMLLSEYGHKQLPPDNPSYANRLERYIKVAKKRKRGLEDAERNFRMLPKVYGFSQTVCLYEKSTEYVRSEPGEPTGRVMPTRWRRGHMRRQWYGPGNSLKKIVIIKPVLVNRHLLIGSEAQTSVTYLSDSEDIRAHQQQQRQQHLATGQAVELLNLQSEIESKTRERKL